MSYASKRVGVSLKALLALNVALIVVSQATGELFHLTGLIHGFALLFIALAATRIFRRYDVYDPELRVYMRYALGAMAIFALSHLIELISIVVLKNYDDVTYAVTIGHYGMSLLLLMAGSAHIMKNYRKTSFAPIAFLWMCFAAVALFSFALLLGDLKISLEPDEAMPYAYALGLLVLAVSSIVQATRIAKLYTAYASYFRHMVVVTVLVSTAAFQYVFYDLLEEAGLPEHQIVYVSHYFFYAALSAMYLAFGESLLPHGVFADVGKLVDQEEALEKPAEK